MLNVRVFAGVAIVVGASLAHVQSQTSLPTRLLQQGDLVHVGSFTLPDVSDNAGQEGFAYSHGTIGFNPANNSLFVVGHDWNQRVAEISIPALGGVATMRQPFTDAFEGKMGQINTGGDPNGEKVGGLFVTGGKLLMTAFSYYDGAGTASKSHFARPTTLSQTGQVAGPFRVGTMPVAFTAGYFAPIPSVWQSVLGGDVLNGLCCISILDRTSAGPSVSSVSASALAAGANASSNTLVAYPTDHRTIGDYESGTFSLTNAYNMATNVKGVVLPEGTASVLFIGWQGVGNICYGTGAQCGDPVLTDQGGHAYPYQGQVWAYSAHDLAAVQAGSKQPWDVKPYAVWKLPGLNGHWVGGAAVDPATGRIFVAENYGDGWKMRIHVYSVNGGTTPPPDTTAPTVTLTSPTPNASVSGTTTFTATASDNVGISSVWFTVDGATVGTEDFTAPYSVTWNSNNVSSGSHIVRAMARDSAGNTAGSATATITVSNSAADTTPPSVNVTTPTLGSILSGVITIGANATDNVGVVGVQFTVNGNNVGPEDTSAPYSTNWSTTGIANGLHIVRAIARDAAGNTATATAVSVTVTNLLPDLIFPAVSVSSPSAGSILGGTVTLSANASDNVGVEGVRFTIDGANVGGEDTSAPYSMSWNTTGVANGLHLVRAVARDAAGNTTTSGAVSVTVTNSTTDTTLPSVSVTAPSANAVVSGNVTITASASDNVGVVGVRFTVDNVNVGAEDLSAPYGITWQSNTMTNGTHTIRAVARDAAGNTRTSFSRTVTVSNTTPDTSLPSVAVTGPASNGSVAGNVTLTASASDNVAVVGVQFRVNGVTVGSEDTSAPYSRTWNAGSLLNGSHVITATARDAAGNTRTSTAVAVNLRNLGSGVPGDLDDDGSADLVFQHANGQIHSWLVQNASLVGESAFTPSAVNPVWQIVGVHDLDGDRKSDLLWQNSQTGQLYFWRLDRRTLIGEGFVSANSTPWRVATTGDFNRDGHADIVWMSPSGALAIWYMQGTTMHSSVPFGPGAIDPSWRLAGTGDFNRDGNIDLLWQNGATGDVHAWLMGGTTVIWSGPITPGRTHPLWQIRAVADLNRDGHSDIVFQHATAGQLYVWFMAGTTLTGDRFFSPSQIDPAWQLVGQR